MKRQNLRGRVPFALAISALMATNIVSPAHADDDVWDEEGDEIISEKPREGDLKDLKDLFDGGESPKDKPKDSQPKPEDKPKGTPESKKEHNDGADVWGEDDEVPPGKKPKDDIIPDPGAKDREGDVLDDLGLGDEPDIKRPQTERKEKVATTADSKARKWSGIDGKRYHDSVRKTDRITYTDAGTIPQVTCDIVDRPENDLIFLSKDGKNLTIVPFIPYGSDDHQETKKLSEQRGAYRYTLPQGSGTDWKITCVKPKQGEKATVALANGTQVFIADSTKMKPEATPAELPLRATYQFDAPVRAISSDTPGGGQGLAVASGTKVHYIDQVATAKTTEEKPKIAKTWDIDADTPVTLVPLNATYGGEDASVIGVGIPDKNLVYAIETTAPTGKASEIGATVTATGDGAKFGTAIVGIGDVNKDEIDDYAIGAPEANHKTGAVAIVYGQKEQAAGTKVTVNLGSDQDNAVQTNGKPSGTLIRQSARGRIGISLGYVQQYDGEKNPGAIVVGRPDNDEHPGAIMISAEALTKNWNHGLGIDSIPWNQRVWFATGEGKGDGGSTIGIVQAADSDKDLTAILAADTNGKVDIWTVDMRQQKEKTEKVKPLHPAPKAEKREAAIKPINTATKKRWVGEFSNGLGSSIARGQCDVTGDGKPDLITSSPMRSEWKFDPYYEDSTETHGWVPNVTGQVQIIPNGTAGSALPDTNIITILGPKETEDPAADAAVGLSVTCLGDVNGDKIADIAFGSHTMGRVWVIYGGPELAKTDLNALDASRGYVIQMPHEFGAAGYHVTSVGDVNKDGLNDVGFIVANTPLSRGERGTYGTALIVAGQRESKDVDLVASYDDPRVIWSARTPEGNTLSAFTPVGDVNADGVQDYVLADFNAYTAGGSVTGKAWVVYGGSAGGYTLAMPENASYRLGAGTSIVSVGDIDADGVGDFAIGFDGGQIEGVTQGGVAIVHGVKEPMKAEQVRKINPMDAAANDPRISIVKGAQAGTGFGWSVDADPKRKIIAIGAWGEDAKGAVYVVDATKIPAGVSDISALGDAVKRIATEAEQARFGRAVAFVGDYLGGHTLAIGADGVIDDHAQDREGYSHAAHLLVLDIDKEKVNPRAGAADSAATGGQPGKPGDAGQKPGHPGDAGKPGQPGNPDENPGQKPGGSGADGKGKSSSSQVKSLEKGRSGGLARTGLEISMLVAGLVGLLALGAGLIVANRKNG